jgi:protein-S-isoprenylcysteine O-methyltransferase Ste14
VTRPALLLVALLLYLALGFGLRTYLHRRRTGSTGFRGISGPPLSAAWTGGVLFVIALAGLVAAPALAWAGVDPPRAHAGWLDAVGLVAVAGGTALLLWSQAAMGASWRIGVDASEQTALVTGGPFRLVRNPIFSALVLSAAGFALLLPGVTAPISVIALVVAIELQVRAVEEPYLIRTHAAYRDYAARVGRFVPGVGRREVSPGPR